MDKEEKQVRILLISDRLDDAEKIKAHLNTHMRLPWNLMHCINLREAAPRINKADIIILELELDGLSRPQQVFRDVGDMVFEIPIIVLTGKNENERDLATFVMEKGAADTIIRGQFGRLVDAIEFAMIRQKITTTARQSSDRVLADSKEQDATDLRDSKSSNATRLHAATDKGAADLKESSDARARDLEKSAQILRMFMGDYSVDSKKDS